MCFYSYEAAVFLLSRVHAFGVFMLRRATLKDVLIYSLKPPLSAFHPSLASRYIGALGVIATSHMWVAVALTFLLEIQILDFLEST